jgi:hypothetical protein
VSEDAFSISGGRSETYCLERAGSNWISYYSERGERTGLESFESEADACAHFFHALTTDPTTQVASH